MRFRQRKAELTRHGSICLWGVKHGRAEIRCRWVVHLEEEAESSEGMCLWSEAGETAAYLSYWVGGVVGLQRSSPSSGSSGVTHVAVLVHRLGQSHLDGGTIHHLDEGDSEDFVAMMPGHRYDDREADLSVELLHGVDGIFSLGEVHKGVISDLLHSLHCACTQVLFLHYLLWWNNTVKKTDHIPPSAESVTGPKRDPCGTPPAVWPVPSLRLLNSFSMVSSVVWSIRFLTYKIFTVAMVSSSTSTSGSAQSTAMAWPQSWIRPDGRALRLINT